MVLLQWLDTNELAYVERSGQWSRCIHESEVPEALKLLHNIHGHFSDQITIMRCIGKFFWPSRHKGTGPEYGQKKWSKEFEKSSKELAEAMNGLAESKVYNKELPIQVRNLHKGSYRCPATISNYFIWAGS